jgi:PAS domain S-box-containing protein
MKIKGKLVTGLGALFVLVMLMAVLSLEYINRLSTDTRNILAANYNSVAYCREMYLNLDDDIKNPEVARVFELNLRKQQDNVTETGEKLVTEKLASDYRQLRSAPGDESLYKIVRRDLGDVMLLNMKAIQRKSDLATDTADKAITWISVAGTLCFLISFVMLINFPGNIANPIKELTESIKRIAAKNYGERVHFHRYDEFGEMADAFNTMAEKLLEYNNSNMSILMTEKKRIETLINNIHEPIIGLDEHKHILFINDEALQISGLRSSDVIGRQAQDIALNNDLIRMLIKDLFADEKSAEPLKIYADQKESYFQKEIIPIKIIPTGEKEEKHIGDVIFLKNITPFKELDFAKTKFVASVSHELKTPISSIKMSTQLLGNEQVGHLNPEQKDLLESIREDASRLLTITSELLNLTQLESGKIQLEIVPVDPEEVLRKAVNANRTQAESRGVRLDVQSHGALPAILADADKTSWVLSNIISNAIRYSYENSEVHIRVGFEEDKGRIVFSVTDTGQGIAPQYLGRIFDRYYRVPGSKREGTGLGLAISKELIESQGGNIDVQSEYGVGSVFSVWLPLVPVNPV